MQKPPRRDSKRWLIGAFVLAAIGSLVGWLRGWFDPDRPSPMEIRLAKDAFTDPRFNERVQQGEVTSKDLDADIELMWETTTRGNDGQPVSTARAINAAGRVFRTVELVGMSGASVIALLGSPVNSNDSVYRGGVFWSIESRALVYRFDNGNFGWQFNVYCEGDDQPVTKVERRWIH